MNSLPQVLFRSLLQGVLSKVSWGLPYILQWAYNPGLVREAHPGKCYLIQQCPPGYAAVIQEHSRPYYTCRVLPQDEARTNGSPLVLCLLPLNM